MPHERPVGIDLGTTFSAVAYVDESGRTAIVRNAEGDLLTPSVVLFDDDEVVVGKEARTATTVHPDLVAEWVKRDMGLPYYTRPIRGHKFPPEVIQGCILRKLKTDAVRTLGELDRVVITVPAYFDEPRRKATADAGEMAGLKVLDIVNEPTAAALAFGETLGYLTPDAAPKEEMTVLVYDLGGGTFDVTLLRLAPGNIQTFATDGDVQLGGHDWDMRLVDHVADRFKRLHKRDPRQDPVGMNRLLDAAIEAKHALSARGRTTIRVEWAGQVIEVPVTREQFEEMTADLLERTSYTTRQLLAAAGREWKDVTRLLLVGGSTRMPMVVNDAPEPERHGARPHGQSRRGGGPRRGAVCRLPAGQGVGQGRPCQVQGHQRQFAQPGRRGDRPRDAAQDERRADSAQHAAAGQIHREIRHEDGEPAIDRGSGSRRRELAAGRMYGHRANGDPRPARGAAQGLARRGHVRVRRERPADGQRGGAGHASERDARWNAPWACRTTGLRGGSGRSATRRASTRSSRWFKRC